MNTILKRVLQGSLIALTAVLLLARPVESSECQTFTEQQSRVLQLSYVIGEPEDLGYTLAAIAMQESFVGRYVVRINPKDGKSGSYGITHVLLETAMWLEGEKSIWKAKQDIVPKLLTDDVYSLRLSIKKLKSYSGTDWKGMVKAYNGSGKMADKYLDKIIKHVKMLKQCNYFEDR